MDVNSVFNGLKNGIGEELGSLIGEISPDVDPQELIAKGKSTLFNIATEQGVTEAAMANMARYGDVGMVTLSALGIVDLVHAKTQGSVDALPEHLRLPFLADEEFEASRELDENGEFKSHRQEQEGRAAVLYTVSSMLSPNGEESPLSRKGKSFMGDDWRAKLIEPEKPETVAPLMASMFEEFRTEKNKAAAEKQEKVERVKARIVELMKQRSTADGKVNISAEDVVLGLGAFSGIGHVATLSKAVAAYKVIQKLRNTRQA